MNISITVNYVLVEALKHNIYLTALPNISLSNFGVSFHRKEEEKSETN